VSKIAADLLDVLLRRERAYAEAVAREDLDALLFSDAPIEVRIFFDWPADALVARGFPIGGHLSHVAQGGSRPTRSGSSR